MELVAATKYNCKYLILSGAILINSDSDLGSFSCARRLDVVRLEDNYRFDLNAYFNEV
jgi:hypothetical protein